MSDFEVITANHNAAYWQRQWSEQVKRYKHLDGEIRQTLQAKIKELREEIERLREEIKRLKSPAQGGAK